MARPPGQASAWPRSTGATLRGVQPSGFDDLRACEHDVAQTCVERRSSEERPDDANTFAVSRDLLPLLLLLLRDSRSRLCGSIDRSTLSEEST